LFAEECTGTGAGTFRQVVKIVKITGTDLQVNNDPMRVRSSYQAQIQANYAEEKRLKPLIFQKN
jgi:hypothetical protein